MMRIPKFQSHDSITIQNQDYTVSCVIRGGPMVSRLDGTTFHQVFDMECPDGSLVFHMTVLEYSKLASKYPDFLNSGLAGWWKVQRCDQQERFRGPRISLQEYVEVTSQDELEKLLLHTSSASFARERYQRLFQKLKPGLT